MIRKGPVCDDGGNFNQLGTVVCRNLGATLLSIRGEASGPTSGMHCLFVLLLFARHNYELLNQPIYFVKMCT